MAELTRLVGTCCCTPHRKIGKMHPEEIIVLDCCLVGVFLSTNVCGSKIAIFLVGKMFH